jgi:predicted tellurium resistance membrane protein TerC
MVFSVDGIITAVGMTDHFSIMVVVVVVSVGVMMAASGPRGAFLQRNPMVLMLALASP